MNKWLTIFVGLAIYTGCASTHSEELPYFGEKEVLRTDEQGNDRLDTVFQKVDAFEFINQDGKVVTAESIAGKIRVVDFFFTSCPTICPKMKRQLLRVYEEFKGNPNFVILSHTIDTRHDSVPVLKTYAEKLGVQTNTWNFMTGSHDSILVAAERYLVTANEDETAPGGYVHSGAFVLLDGSHFIRGYYDGTNPDDVDAMMRDIELLLAK